MHDHFNDLSGELAVVLARLHDRYADPTPPPVGPGLSAFLGVDLTNEKGDLSATAASNANEPAAQVVGLPNWRASITKGRQRIVQSVAAFIGTTVGKVVLGTTVAAASVGGVQAAGIVDLTPDPAPTEVVAADSHDDEADTCSDQADAIEDAAEGQGDGAEEAAEAEADAFEEACEAALDARDEVNDHDSDEVDDDEPDEVDDHDSDEVDED